MAGPRIRMGHTKTRGRMTGRSLWAIASEPHWISATSVTLRSWPTLRDLPATGRGGWDRIGPFRASFRSGPDSLLLHGLAVIRRTTALVTPSALFPFRNGRI